MVLRQIRIGGEIGVKRYRDEMNAGSDVLVPELTDEFFPING